jgi:hypothetical protein
MAIPPLWRARGSLECHDIRLYSQLTRARCRRFTAYRGHMSKELDPPRHVSRYTDAETELGLRALAIASGNARKASSLLARQNIEIPRTTLQMWAHELYRERYRQIKRDVMPAIYERIAEHSERIVEDLGDLEDRLVQQMREQASELSPRDTAGALRNVSVSKAINIDKASLVRGRPTEISATADVTELLKSPSRFGEIVKVNSEILDLDGRATEEPDEPS